MTVETVVTVGELEIIYLYANEWNETYGDIYTEIEDLLREHPDSMVIRGFGIYDPKTGFSPDWVDDFYAIVSEAISHASSKQVEPLVSYPRGIKTTVFVVATDSHSINADSPIFSDPDEARENALFKDELAFENYEEGVDYKVFSMEVTMDLNSVKE